MADAPRRIVLLRHGRTEWNAAHRIQGQLDPGLDEVGIEQARAAAPSIAALEPALLWSSDLARARETADEVAKLTGSAASYDPRLREFHLGERQGLTHQEYDAVDAEEFGRFLRFDWDSIPGAETAEQVATRYTAALRDLAAALAPGELAVAVSHGASTRTGVLALLGWPTSFAADLRPLDNCARVDLEQRPSGAWTLAAYNRPAGG